MTSNPPGPRDADAAFDQPPNKSRLQLYHQDPPPDKPPSGLGPTGGLSFRQDKLEPVIKRRKLGSPEDAEHIGSLEDAQQNASPNDADGDPAAAEGTTTRRSSCRNAAPSSNSDKSAGSGRLCPFFPAKPQKPSRRGDVRRNNTIVSENAISRGEAQSKLTVLEPPGSAPRYKENSLADYFLWHGNHPEDVLNELTTKQGFYDNVQVSQNESGTARPTVWSNLRHKSGLQILSSLFVSALDQRQKHGTIKAPCTFKPPPRVTLTDAKREAWLRDLADSAIPLRRLSRTIPHGIRGKVLLDQCSAKNIPVGRAIWLVKCVGANEIRAFKRKGANGAFAVGGETKWIRDWTSNVETFVESITGDCGKPQWRDKVDYCLRLITHLFAENLLAQDHYLDWVVTSLRNSDLDNILTWILITQIHWKEILQHRKRGQRLVEATLDKLSEASGTVGAEVYAPISDKLAQLLQALVLGAPACCLIPNRWTVDAARLKWASNKGGQDLNSQHERLSQRNMRIGHPPLTNNEYERLSSQRRIISLLDSVSTDSKIGAKATECLGLINDHLTLIATCVNWATSIYRYGHARIYIVVRFFRKWAKSGINLERPLFAFLATQSDVSRSQAKDLYRLLAELVHSKHLLVSRYLQWLIASGAIIDRNRDTPETCDVRWIFELPLHDLPAHIINLRRILLSSINTSIPNEDAILATTKSIIATQTHGLCQFSQASESYAPRDVAFHELSQTVKSATGRWIRQAVATCFPAQAASAKFDYSLDSLSDSEKHNGINVHQFYSVRDVLEKLEDFPILADVIKFCSRGEDMAVLIAASDTTNCHFDTFVAIGAAEDLFKALHRQCERTYSQTKFEKSFVVSLIELGGRLSHSAGELSKLRAYLLAHRQKLSTSAFSPISDSMVETLQSSESGFMDEVEQVLSSGTSMDKQTLSQLFHTISSRLQLSWIDSKQRSSIDFAELFLQLRDFDTDTFQGLMHSWLDILLTSPRQSRLSDALLPLICAGLVDLTTIVEMTVSLIDKDKLSDLDTSTIMEVFDLLMMTEVKLFWPSRVCREYRFHIQKQWIIRESSSLIVPLLRAVTKLCANRTHSICAKARALIENHEIGSVIQGLLGQHSQSSGTTLNALEEGISEQSVQEALDKKFFASYKSDSNLYNRISKILELTNILSAPLCKIRLKAILAATPGREIIADALVALFKNRTKVGDGTNIHVWAEVVSDLPAYQAAAICNKAEQELFSIAASDPKTDCHEEMMHALLVLINATVANLNASQEPSNILHIAKQITSLLSPTELFKDKPHNDQARPGANNDVTSSKPSTCIDTFLRLITIHQSANQLTKLPDSALVPLLITLSLLLIHPALTHSPSISEHTFDVLAYILDSISDDTHSRCVYALRDHHCINDPRLQFLFGYSNPVQDGWLQVLTTTPPTTTANSISTPAVTDDGPPSKKSLQPFRIRKWEMMQDATPLMTENDTSLSLTLFGAKKAV